MSKSIALNIDCMEYMATLPDKAFDLAIVDPPYGINAGKMTMGSGKHAFSKNKDWDKSIPDAKYFSELFRVSKNQIIWGGNYFTNYLPPSKNWILWDKQNPNLSFAEGELAWARKGDNLRIFQYYSAMQNDKIHPTQKPVELYEWILNRYAKKGDKILDTHLGSGSSRIAAYNLGFDFVGCEIDKEYFEKQEERFARHTAQTSLFVDGGF